ncbi:histone deacetylase family protein [Rhodoplanes sp. TEM]|uniref:Histone deacetylase family protein n=1 Tax=Rhodoplanes tepidamans TaxID=200616 RepID=A0ABT5J5H6_RHOTP|nr:MULTISPECIES: histone deacetylase family protein [Rhodoplanes]MDC7784838.1 histone deacetylase family protein [Rhodoplanes tepidamans]MDC7982305.1 histone deacetylase family protein [Rhodoplanes sp. TEM]MDQ0356314.1 acetoin utilization deacetylase AcuC-like enzyme [Rhodoplanes tepidamans]
MITVYSDDHVGHDGKAELHDGKLVPSFEMPRRAALVLARVQETGLGPVMPPKLFGLDPVRRVHAADYVAFLEGAWDAWVAEHGPWDALPFTWIAPGMRRVVPDHIDGKLGYYSFDAGTPITAGTWRAVRAAADVALTGAELIVRGERGAFALCRPPGHHAHRACYGGYCFFNNAAIAAQALRDAGAERVAVLDIDCHHGNGTQDIFYDRGDVLFVSLHADPVQEYPYFLGFADETGTGAGEGANANYPLPFGTDFAAWSEALAHALARIAAFGAEALVVSLGVDTFKGDPISRFRLDSPDYTAIGERLAAAGLPTLFVMEGGYAVEAIGLNAVNVLQGFRAAA